MKAVFEPISRNLNQSFHYRIFEKTEFETPWHYHPEWELTFITESTGIRSVGNSIQTYQAGELVLLGPNLPHCWKTNKSTKQLAKSTVVQFNDDFQVTGGIGKVEFFLILKMPEKSNNVSLFNT